MPLKRCAGKGWMWGSKGKCYTGKDAKKKALKQGYAQNPEHFSQIMKSESHLVDQNTIAELIKDEETPIEILDILMEYYQPTNLMDKILVQEHVHNRKMSKKL